MAVSSALQTVVLTAALFVDTLSPKELDLRTYPHEKEAKSMYMDMNLNCRERNCASKTFVWTAGEQRFYAERGFSAPNRCPSCRAARKGGNPPTSTPSRIPSAPRAPRGGGQRRDRTLLDGSGQVYKRDFMSGKWEKATGPMGTPVRDVNPITGAPKIRSFSPLGGKSRAYNGAFKVGGPASSSKGGPLFNRQRRRGGPFG